MSKWTQGELDFLVRTYERCARERKSLFPTLTDKIDRSEGSIRWQLRKLREDGVIKYYSSYPVGAENTTPSPPDTTIKRLYWDIETAPNIGFFWEASKKVWLNPQQIIQERAIICIGYKWEGEPNTYSLVWNNGDDREMIAEFLKIATEADELVAHYGDSFDIKWFNTQCLKYGLEALPEPKTIDTGVIARRRFNFNSNKLDYIAQLLLGRGKKKTNFGMWREIVLNNDPDALKAMTEYCEYDVQLLEEVYQLMSGFHPVKSHAGVMAGYAKWTCAYCASHNVRRKKRRVTAKGTVQHSMKCNDCNRHYTISDTEHKKFLKYNHRS